MSLLDAKREAVKTCGNILRKTILGDLEDLRFELHGADVISMETCEKKSAGDMVLEIQHRLATDETVWDKLIGVLNKCKKSAVIEQLLEQLRQESGGDILLSSSDNRSGEVRRLQTNPPRQAPPSVSLEAF